MKPTTRLREMKATLKGRNQEIKRLKKLIKFRAEVYQQTLKDYHEVVIDLQGRIDKLSQKVEKLNKRKWYQFRVIN